MAPPGPPGSWYPCRPVRPLSAHFQPSQPPAGESGRDRLEFWSRSFLQKIGHQSWNLDGMVNSKTADHANHRLRHIGSLTEPAATAKPGGANKSINRDSEPDSLVALLSRTPGRTPDNVGNSASSNI